MSASGAASTSFHDERVHRALEFYEVDFKGGHHLAKAKRLELVTLSLAFWPLLDDADLVQGDFGPKVTSLWLD